MALFSLGLFSYGQKEAIDTRRNLTLDNAFANIPNYILQDVKWYFNSEAVCKRNLIGLQIGESYQVGYKRDQQSYLIFTKTGELPVGHEPVPVIIIDKNCEPKNVIKRTSSYPKMEGATSPRLEDCQEPIEKAINYQILCNKFLCKYITWFSDKLNPKPILPTVLHRTVPK